MFEKDLTIITDEKFKDKSEVIAYLANLSNSNVTDAAQYKNDVIERESIVPTYVGFGIAIPHARTIAVSAPFVICAKLKQSVVWGEPDETVNHVFMLGVPKSEDGKQEDGRLHLKILSELSKSLMRNEFREALMQAKSNEEMYQLLKGIEEDMKL